MYTNSIKVKNYKCFKGKFEGFEKILPINVIIGKNNSGKSTLVDLIESVFTSKATFPEIISEYYPTFDEFKDHVTRFYGTAPNEQTLKNMYRDFTKIMPIFYKFNSSVTPNSFRIINDYEINKFPTNLYGYDLKSVFERIQFSFENYQFQRINAERDIKSEDSNYTISVMPNGEGATNIIQQFLNRKDLNNYKLIKSNLLNNINEIVSPEIEFIDILTQVSNKDSSWEICFEDRFGNNIFLSQMGSGIKTIIFVLINLLLLPTNSKIDIENYIFAFEELENNLHPSLQRRLYQYIKKFVQKNKCTFFITTHSNISIDVFYNSNYSQLIAINNTEGVSSCKTVVQNQHLSDLLLELGFKASDLLQTNGIIWVEGPSDRNYIKKWICLLDNNLIEGVHYTVMFYGGKLLSHLTFNEREIEEFIQLLRINRNAFVIIDRDAKGITDKINKTKQRIQSEIGDNRCWITCGREIENYIPESIIKKWLKNKKGETIENLQFGKFEKLENILPSTFPKYNLDKNVYSKEIVDFISEPDLNILDLKSKIQDLVKSIKIWNF